ncbi:hypothetical protein TRVL_07953 [Trypanosoma vivax]|nr:hypothetical protein TRVL_07953 [Trypanosoma vivax]
MQCGVLPSLTSTQSAQSVLNRCEDDATVKAYLSAYGKGLFASSAYWGVSGDVPPREPDVVTGNKPHRFATEINRKLIPLPNSKTSLPRQLDYTHIGLHRIKEDTQDAPSLNAAQMSALYGRGQLHGTGLSASAKPRLLEETNTQKRTIGKGALGPEVINALKTAEANLATIEDERAQLKSKPLESSDPDPYRATSWDYCDMSGIDPSSYRVNQLSPETAGTPAVYKSRYNLVEREGPLRRKATAAMMEKERSLDENQLRATLQGTKKILLPDGYRTWSAGQWVSTAHNTYTPYDMKAAAESNGRYATVPIQRTQRPPMATQGQGTEVEVKKHSETRNGDWATEYSDSYFDKTKDTDVTKDFSKKSIFDLWNGVYTMHHSAHHPRSDVVTGESYKPFQIVPGQYVSMASQPLHARNAVQ